MLGGNTHHTSGNSSGGKPLKEAEIDVPSCFKSSVLVSTMCIVHIRELFGEWEDWLKSAKVDESKYLPTRLLYLSDFLDALALHDEVVIFDPPRADLLFEETFPRYSELLNQSEFFKPLIRAGAIRFLPIEEKPYLDQRTEIYRTFVTPHSDMGHKALNNYGSHFALEFVIAKEQGFSYRGSHESRELDALQAIGESERQLVSQLAQAFERATADIMTKTKRLLEARRSHGTVLPPIAAVIMERSKRDKAVLAFEALNLREKMSNLRTKFREIESQLRDDSLPLEKSLKLFDRLDSSIEAVAPVKGSAATIIREWRDLADFEKLVQGFHVTDSASFTKALLGAPLDFILRKFKGRNLSFISNLKSDFLKIHNYGELASDTFKTPITNEGIKRLEEHLKHK